MKEYNLRIRGSTLNKIQYLYGELAYSTIQQFYL